MMYNTTLTIFTVRDKNNKECTFDLPNVKLVDFDPNQLLIDYNFTEVISDIMSWKDKDLTRTSDIIRLCIAHRVQYVLRRFGYHLPIQYYKSHFYASMFLLVYGQMKKLV